MKLEEKQHALRSNWGIFYASAQQLGDWSAVAVAVLFSEGELSDVTGNIN